jgi:hypothetical protein
MARREPPGFFRHLTTVKSQASRALAKLRLDDTLIAEGALR